jgi:uncharacterized protein YndB with AHSA1/START domain
LDRIERSTLIRAPRSRVWRAVTSIKEFNAWFSTESDEPAFRPGAEVRMRSTFPGPHYGKKFVLHIEEMLPEEKFSWRWHPGAPGQDVSQEPMTLVTFTLEDAEGGTRVTVTETGFDSLFAARREAAYKGNEGGWRIQMGALEQYLHEKA